MRAARFHGPQDIRIEDVPAPTLRPALEEIDLRGTIAYVRDHPAVIKLVHKDTEVKNLVHP
jgi:hypothetical protein